MVKTEFPVVPWDLPGEGRGRILLGTVCTVPASALDQWGACLGEKTRVLA